MNDECFRNDLRKRVNSSRWFHTVLLLSGTIFLPIVNGILINMYTAGTYQGSGYVLLVSVGIQLAVSVILIIHERQIREPSVILMDAEDKCRDLLKIKHELTRRDEAYRMVRSAFDALNKQVCDMLGSPMPFSDGLSPIVEKFTASIWTVLGCTSNRYTIEAYFEDYIIDENTLYKLADHPLVFFASPTVQPQQAVELRKQHPAILNWHAGVGRDSNEIKNLPATFFPEGKRDSALYFNRYAVVTIPTQCQSGRLGLLVLTAEQEESFSTNVLDTLEFLATIISSYHNKYSECLLRHQEHMELQQLRQQRQHNMTLARPQMHPSRPGMNKGTNPINGSTTSGANQEKEGEKASPIQLTIEKATYGFETVRQDVTEAVKKHVKNEHLSFIVTNDNLGGDPCPNKRKELSVTYSVGNMRETKVVKERDRIELP